MPTTNYTNIQRQRSNEPQINYTMKNKHSQRRRLHKKSARANDIKRAGRKGAENAFPLRPSSAQLRKKNIYIYKKSPKTNAQ